MHDPRQKFQQTYDTMTEESSIADKLISTPEEIAYSDEMITLVQYAMRAAARPDREAFILHAIEGFSLDEIAAITDRTVVQVEQSIRAAREKLRHSFPVNNPFKEKVLPQTGTA